MGISYASLWGGGQTEREVDFLKNRWTNGVSLLWNELAKKRPPPAHDGCGEGVSSLKIIFSSSQTIQNEYQVLANQ